MLDQTCMLASLTIRSWTAEAKDRKITREVADQHGTAENAGRYTKKLIAEGAIKAIQSIASAARADHYTMTLPWSNEGARILPAVLWDDYSQKMSAHRLAYKEQVDQFVANYDGLVDEARRRLNGMFNDNDYPNVNEVRYRFGFAVKVTPVPTARDFRVSLAGPDVEQIRADIEAQTREAMTLAQQDVRQRLSDAVSHMAERLGQYDGGKRGSFRDTLVDNVRDLVVLLPKLMIQPDDAFIQLVREADSKLTRYDAEALRKDEAVRSSVQAEAAQIYAKLQRLG